jgi:tight adherence protein C
MSADLFLLLAVVGAIIFAYRYIASSVLQYLAIRKRLATQPAQRYAVAADVSDLGFDVKYRATGAIAALDGWANIILEPGGRGKNLRAKLIRAGFFSAYAVTLYLLAQMALALLMPVILLGFTVLYAPGADPIFKYGMPMMLAIMGFICPDAYLRRRGIMVQDECRRGFPDCLDLMVIATEAGMSVEASLARIVPEIIVRYPVLGANIYLMTLELRLGRSLNEVLDGLVDRTQIDDIRSFATLIQQSRELGSSISQALRVYSQDMRFLRLSRAEEKAHALPAKLVVPLGLFLFPIMLLIVLLPVAMRVRASLLASGG